jgi:hypothetical protein
MTRNRQGSRLDIVDQSRPGVTGPPVPATLDRAPDLAEKPARQPPAPPDDRLDGAVGEALQALAQDLQSGKHRRRP